MRRLTYKTNLMNAVSAVLLIASTGASALAYTPSYYPPGRHYSNTQASMNSGGSQATFNTPWGTNSFSQNYSVSQLSHQSGSDTPAMNAPMSVGNPGYSQPSNFTPYYGPVSPNYNPLDQYFNYPKPPAPVSSFNQTSNAVNHSSSNFSNFSGMNGGASSQNFSSFNQSTTQASNNTAGGMGGASQSANLFNQNTSISNTMNFTIPPIPGIPGSGQQTSTTFNTTITTTTTNQSLR